MKNLLFIIGIVTPAWAVSSEPDFVIALTECKMLVGSLKNGSLNSSEAETMLYSCQRQGKNISCTTTFDKSKNSDNSSEKFSILIDSPPVLWFASENHGTFFSVDIQTRAAVVTARLTDLSYMGQKVCSGVYATAHEIELLKNKN
jgi:hypothetical protein